MSSNLDFAIYHTVHDFPGGARALASHVAVRAGTLNNKADPACDTHNLTYQEGIAIQLATKDYRIISAEASILGGSFLLHEDLCNVSDVALLDTWAAWMAQEGLTAQAVRDSLEDSKITREESQKIHRKMHESIQRALEFLRRIDSLVVDDE